MKGRGKSPGLFPNHLLVMFASLNFCNVKDIVFGAC